MEDSPFPADSRAAAVLRLATRIQSHRSQEFVAMGANHAGERKRKKAKNTRKIEETKARKAAQTAGK